MTEQWVRWRPWVGTVARLVLGAVWIWASLSKLHDPRGFTQAVRAYDATPEWLSQAIGYGLPVLEFCLGVLLIIGVMTRIVAAVSGVLLVVFFIGLVQAAARGLQLACGCFGGGGTTDGSTSYTLDILRDLGLLVLAVFLVVWPFTRISLEEYLARHDRVEPPSAKRMRDPQARRRYEAQLAAVATRARARNLYLTSSLAVVVVLVSIIGIGVQAKRAKVDVTVLPVSATLSDGVVFGKAAPATVDVYEDFGCPICLGFEQSTHAQLQNDVRANLAQVRYHPIAILDRSSPNRYSTRAANASICADDASTEAFIKLHNILYGTVDGKQVQPREGTPGPTNYELQLYGKQAGLTGTDFQTYSACVDKGVYDLFVTGSTDKASQRGVTGTPTVYVNGKQVSANGPALFAAIKAADAGHTPHPSVTPSPSASMSPSGAPSPPVTPAPSSSGA